MIFWWWWWWWLLVFSIYLCVHFFLFVGFTLSTYILRVVSDSLFATGEFNSNLPWVPAAVNSTWERGKLWISCFFPSSSSCCSCCLFFACVPLLFLVLWKEYSSRSWSCAAKWTSTGVVVSSHENALTFDTFSLVVNCLWGSTEKKCSFYARS